jgi:hypothetical protein
VVLESSPGVAAPRSDRVRSRAPGVSMAQHLRGTGQTDGKGYTAAVVMRVSVSNPAKTQVHRGASGIEPVGQVRVAKLRDDGAS